jgi:hypothetical protein
LFFYVRKLTSRSMGLFVNLRRNIIDENDKVCLVNFLIISM